MALTGGQKYKPVKYTGSEQEVINNLHEQLDLLKQQWKEFFEEKVKEYVRIYKGEPRDAVKSFPWQGASNIVIKVAAASVDTLNSKIISSIYENSPLWPVEVIGGWEDKEEAEKQRELIESFLSFCGFSKEELDTYRVENLWCHEHIKMGHSTIKLPYERSIEYTKIQIEGGQPVETPITKKDGPAPEKLLITDFMADVNAPTLDKAPCKVQIVRLKKWELLNRKVRGLYDSGKIEAILAKPDRGGPDPQTLEIKEGEGFDVSKIPGGAEWDIYECWFEHWQGDRKYQLIASYHFASKTLLKCTYNFYPDNEVPYITTKLGHDQDGLRGRGYSDLLKDYQEEVTVNHNQRVDKRTLLNTNVFRLSTGTKLDQNFKFFPGMGIPAESGAFEAVPLGQDTYPNSVNDEMLTLKLSEDLVGSGASTGGMGGLGSGTVGKTTGAYSSMGTYSVMQDGNRRVGQRITDFKYAHEKYGQLAAKMYAHFGVAGKAQLFGLDAQLLDKALASFLGKKLGFSVKAATASINREVEKQNYLLLSGNLQRHYTTVGQLIQAVQNPQIPPTLKDYLVSVITANNQLMKMILRVFNIEDSARLVPEPQMEPQNNGQSGVPTAATGDVQGNPGGEAYPSLPQANTGDAANPSMGALGSLLQGA